MFGFLRSSSYRTPSILRSSPIFQSNVVPRHNYFPRTFSTQEKLFDKILIANRGEIACRVIKTAKKLGIKTVAIFSEPDATALHVRMADEAYCVGPAKSSESYLNIPKIIKVIKESGAQAVHPGYGFLSENSHFVEALEKEGIVFIGPGTQAMHAMGDKIESKKIAKAAGVNIIPGFLGETESLDHALKIAHEIGYPVMIKASGGGGGKGMRIAWNDEEALEGFRLSKQESLSAFGDDRLLVEKYIDNPRHIEIQIMCDGQGTSLYLPERECSIQRRNQKVLEEAPSVHLDQATREAMGKQAVALADAVGYKSAGTCEFLCDSQRNFYFLEMNTRLQVEHPVTEYITKLDLVEEMIRVAAGQKLRHKQSDIKIHGWAMEARVYAEDPRRNFLPFVGRLNHYQEPTSTDGTIRVDTGVVEGSEISTNYDPLISKLVSYGPNRDSAIDTLARALDSYVIRGLNHNVCFLRDTIVHPRYRSGKISTKFIPEEYPKGYHGHTLTEKESFNLLATASVVQFYKDIKYDHSLRSDRTISHPTSANYVVSVEDLSFRSDMNVVGENEYQIKLTPVTGGESKIIHLKNKPSAGALLVETECDGKEVIYQLHGPSNYGFKIQFHGTVYDVSVESEFEHELRTNFIPEIETVDTTNSLISPMPGTVVSVNVKPGDRVAFGHELCVLEAMKMQNVLRSTRGGVISKVNVKPGSKVDVDEVLLEFDPTVKE